MTTANRSKRTPAHGKSAATKVHAHGWSSTEERAKIAVEQGASMPILGLHPKAQATEALHVSVGAIVALTLQCWHVKTALQRE